MENQSKIKLVLIGSHQLECAGITSLLNSSSECFEIIQTLRFDENAIKNIQKSKDDLDVILLLFRDYHFEFLEQLHSAGDFKVIVLSDLTNREIMEQCVLFGVRGFLGPDATVEQLSKAVVKVAAGELWLDRFTTSRLVSKLSVKKNSESSANVNQNLIDRLTDREKTILRAILDGEGRALRDLAESLYISEYTLRNHLTAMYSKLELKNRLDLYVFARSHLKKFNR